jgi:hypothetical protein
MMSDIDRPLACEARGGGWLRQALASIPATHSGAEHRVLPISNDHRVSPSQAVPSDDSERCRTTLTNDIEYMNYPSKCQLRVTVCCGKSSDAPALVAPGSSNLDVNRNCGWHDRMVPLNNGPHCEKRSLLREGS